MGFPLRVGLLLVSLALHPRKRGQALHIPKPCSPLPLLAAIVSTFFNNELINLTVRTYTTYPDNFPASWASGWGEDEYGLWMTFNYKGVRHLFRWCEPVTFLMGSPEDESEREVWESIKETQHSVTFSSGFWIAEIPVTQALWEIFNGRQP